jgi:hypothetical protein
MMHAWQLSHAWEERTAWMSDEEKDWRATTAKKLGKVKKGCEVGWT